MRAGTKKISSVFLVFLGVYLTVRYLGPLFLPFLIGGALALAAEPMTSFFQKRMKLPRAVSTGISVSMAFCLLVLLVLLAAAFFLRELRTLAGVLPNLEDTARSGMTLMENWLLSLTARTPESVRPLLDRNVTEFFSGGTKLLDGIMGWVLGLAGGVLAHVPDSALGLGTAVISGFMISAKLPKIRLWLKNRIPLERLQPVFQAAERVKRVVGGWLFAQTKLAGVTWGLLTLGFWILRISYPPLWALAVALVDAFPVLGTGTILVPWAHPPAAQGERLPGVHPGGCAHPSENPSASQHGHLPGGDPQIAGRRNLAAGNCPNANCRPLRKAGHPGPDSGSGAAAGPAGGFL